MIDPAFPNVIEGLELRVVDTEVIVHDRVHQKLHILNRTAGRILELCDGTHAPAEIATRLAEHSSTPHDLILADVTAAIDTFRSMHVVR